MKDNRSAPRFVLCSLFFVLSQWMGRGSPGLPSARTGRVGWLPVPYTTPTTDDRRPTTAADRWSAVSGRWSTRKERVVSHYSIDELIARWKKGSLTVEQ